MNDMYPEPKRTPHEVNETLDQIIHSIKLIVPALIALIVAVGSAVALFSDSSGPTSGVPTATPVAGEPSPASIPPVTVVDGPDTDTRFDDVLPLDQEAQDVVENAVNSTGSELDNPLREPNDGPAVQNEGPLAGQEFPGCRTRFVQNSSSRRGTTPRVIVWHYTVSSNRPGWSDVDGLTAYANNLASGVSWHFLLDAEGNCNYTVPLNLKAWTQGNANPFSIGIEVVATGAEKSFPPGDGGRRRLLAVTRELGRRFQIPMRRGRVTNCRVERAGVIQHADLGECGGGHHDIEPFRVQPLINELNRRPTATDIATCRKLNAWRGNGRPRNQLNTNIRRREALASRGVTCVKTGPVIR